MTLAEAMAILGGVLEGDREAAWSVIVAELESLSYKVWRNPSPSIREDSVQEAVLKTIRMIERGTFAEMADGQVRSYLRSIVKSAFADQYRARKRQQRVVEAQQAEAKVAGHAVEDGDELDTPLGPSAVERATALVRRVAEAACVASPKAAKGVRESTNEMLRLASKATDVRTILITERGVDPNDQTAFRKERDALFKRHERARTRLLETADALEGAGELSAMEAEAMRGCVQGWLLRRKMETP